MNMNNTTNACQNEFGGTVMYWKRTHRALLPFYCPSPECLEPKLQTATDRFYGFLNPNSVKEDFLAESNVHF